MTPKAIAVPPRKVLHLKMRIKRFFAERPDEELSHELIMAKFGCTYRASRWVVSELIEDGLLESVHTIRLRSAGKAKESKA